MLSRQRVLPAGFIEPCLPTKALAPPSGGLWVHEIKHDGFRVIARKIGARVRLYSRSSTSCQVFFASLFVAVATSEAFTTHGRAVRHILGPFPTRAMAEQQLPQLLSRRENRASARSGAASRGGRWR